MLQKIKEHKTLALCLAGAVLAVCAAGAVWLLAPSQRIDLDVNPSIELVTNRLDKVVSIKPVNQDARALLQGYVPADRDLDDVVEDLVERMIAQGYLGQGKANDVLITVDDSAASPQVLEQVNRAIAAILERQKLTAALHTQSVDLELYEERAQQLQVSAGRMSVIDRLAQGDATLSPADLADTKVSDLLAWAREKGIPLDLLEDRLDLLEDRFDDDPTLEALEDGLDAAEDALEPHDRDDHDDRDDSDDRDDLDDFDDRDDLDDMDDWDDLDEPDDFDGPDDTDDEDDGPDDLDDDDDWDDVDDD